jgi:hypothetical protein
MFGTWQKHRYNVAPSIDIGLPAMPRLRGILNPFFAGVLH